MRIAPWQPGDEAAIIDLFMTVFNQPMSLDAWRWRYLDHPDGDPLVMLAWDGELLAGHYGASHAPIRIDGGTVPAALSVSTMTHPDYRGRGLLEQCARPLYGEMQARGIRTVWGFPNASINALRQSKLDWEPIADVAMLIRDLAPDASFMRGATEIVPQIDARFDALNQSPKGIWPDHSARILAWRIDRNPHDHYRRLILPVDGGAEIAGYAILKPYVDEKFDLVALRARDSVSYATLIQAALAEAAEAGARRVSTWALPRDPARLALERAGFTASGPVSHLGGRCLGASSPSFGDSRLWHLAMLDSDLY